MLAYRSPRPAENNRKGAKHSRPVCPRQAAPLVLALCSAGLTLATLRFSSATADWHTAFDFLERPLTFLCNWLPIAGWMALVYAALSSPAAAFALAAVPALGLSFINYYKLTLRGDPLLYADLRLAGEATAMTGRYDVRPTAGVIAVLTVTVGVTVLLWLWCRRTPRLARRTRLWGAAVCTALLAGYAVLVMPGDALYADTGLACAWLPTQSYTAHGVLYPFLHSVADAQDTPPTGYNAAEAQSALAAYSNADIPAQRQADVVAIMLEAFNDFSSFTALTFDADPYADWHALTAEGYCGQLVTNIFAGETVNTERAFLLGETDPTENIRAAQDSFVWYFRKQGYTCLFDHPGYGWFYNRMNVDTYLGFASCRFYEDTYRSYATDGGIASDAAFLGGLLDRYREAAAQDAPVFSFSVTYQNHGPYATEAACDTVYLSRCDGCDEADYNIANNYLTGIADTGRQLRSFVESFRTLNRPVIVVIFGDHNPWWGDNNSTYEAYGINLDRETEEGFYNYYCTPFLIWANDAAKATLGNPFTGDGGRLSPALLMTRLFDLAGWDGPAYMQALRELETHTTVVNRLYYQNGDTLCRTDGDQPDWLERFQSIAYWRRHQAVALP